MYDLFFYLKYEAWKYIQLLFDTFLRCNVYLTNQKIIFYISV
jgi:hypothetical protein